VHLEQISVENWRNLEPVELSLSSSLTVFFGENAAGKTNLLEAVGLLATLKSFRDARWKQLPNWEASSARVVGVVTGETGRRKLECTVTPEGRKLRLDGSNCTDNTRWFECLRAVVFTPSDPEIVRGSPDQRRRFLDRAAFNAWPTHLHSVRSFKQVLSQRSALLRSGRADATQLAIWDEQLLHWGIEVDEGRRRLLAALIEPLATIHEELAGKGLASAHYRSRLQGDDKAQRLQSYARLLTDVRSDELHQQRNLVGPQRDDLVLTIDGRPARTVASQGQVRTLALSLKLAELAVAKSSGEPPLMLVDDLSSELDQDRVGRLVNTLRALEAQVLVTTTDPSPILRHGKEDASAYFVSGGKVDPRPRHG